MIDFSPHSPSLKNHFLKKPLSDETPNLVTFASLPKKGSNELDLYKSKGQRREKGDGSSNFGDNSDLGGRDVRDLDLRSELSHDLGVLKGQMQGRGPVASLADSDLAFEMAVEPEEKGRRSDLAKGHRDSSELRRAAGLAEAEVKVDLVGEDADNDLEVTLHDESDDEDYDEVTSQVEVEVKVGPEVDMEEVRTESEEIEDSDGDDDEVLPEVCPFSRTGYDPKRISMHTVLGLGKVKKGLFLKPSRKGLVKKALEKVYVPCKAQCTDQHLPPSFLTDAFL